MFQTSPKYSLGGRYVTNSNAMSYSNVHINMATVKTGLVQIISLQQKMVKKRLLENNDENYTKRDSF